MHDLSGVTNNGVCAYKISRAMLNCNGQSDYDMANNKSCTDKYKLSGETLTKSTVVLTRN